MQAARRRPSRKAGVKNAGQGLQSPATIKVAAGRPRDRKPQQANLAGSGPKEIGLQARGQPNQAKSLWCPSSKAAVEVQRAGCPVCAAKVELIFPIFSKLLGFYKP